MLEVQKLLSTSNLSSRPDMWGFKENLIEDNLSESTILSYLNTLKLYFTEYSDVTKKNLLDFRMFLISNYKPKTINLRVQAINRYLEYIKKDKYKLRTVKVQQKPYLENVISDADYRYFKDCLLNNEALVWYFVVRFLAATGARVSELVQIKAEHVHVGYLDIYSKSGKVRRIYIPKQLKEEALDWLDWQNVTSGFIFINQRGEPLCKRSIGTILKSFALKYGVNPKVVYPHSFRHLFAKNFLDSFNDLALLADLMGHESIETTRIYLRRTANEQREIIDRVITW